MTAKAKGQEIIGEEAPPEATNVIDLMDALQRSVEQTRKSRRRPKAGGGGAKRKPSGTRPMQKRTVSASGKKLEQMSKGQLYEQATQRDVHGRSKMNRDQLIRALTRTS
ncbi:MULTISPECIES: hypothetical protein [unclassified Streptomyces]|uniref:hypothetical protein n=1 Tax=unclassified Streptomyces TaxID=2593676 RepID=UPI003D8B551B